VKRPSPADVLKTNQKRALALAERTGPARVRRMLLRAQADLVRRLRETEGLAAPGEEPFTQARLRVTLEQVRAVLRDLLPGMRGAIVDASREAAERRAQDTLRYLNRAEKRFTGIAGPLPIDEAGMLDAAARGTEASVLRRIASDPAHPGRPGVLDRYGESVVGDFEERLQTRFLARQSWGEVRDAVVGASDFLQAKPAHWAERIVRTELMGAQNRAGWESIRFAQRELGDVVKVVSCVFDSRTGADSYAVHGQIRRPEEAFASWFGLFQHPPDRPNDRGVVVPHRVAWPIPPELQPRSDGEVATRWSAEGRKGSPPARPKMTTVDRRIFGK
jgi:hypothetical protein